MGGKCNWPHVGQMELCEILPYSLFPLDIFKGSAMMFTMIEHYTMEAKPTFIDGQVVKVDMERLGCPTYGIMSGKIVGKTFVHVIDTWLIEFNVAFAPTYPFKVLGVPHTAIIKSRTE